MSGAVCDGLCLVQSVCDGLCLMQSVCDGLCLVQSVCVGLCLVQSVMVCVWVCDRQICNKLQQIAYVLLPGEITILI